MNDNATVYACDEDVAIRTPGDFTMLCPTDQCLACGKDGFFGDSDRWTLRSTTVDFAAQGVRVGHIVQLLAPANQFRPPGELLAVAASGPGWIRMRRKGQLEGEGQPPAPAGGLTGVEFLIATLTPQIAAASYELNRIYGIEELVGERQSTDLFDTRELCDVVVLLVLMRTYRDISRGTVSSPDTFAEKASILGQELDDLLGHAVIHWQGRATSSARFQTRLTR